MKSVRIKAVYTGGYMSRNVDQVQELHAITRAASTPTTINATVPGFDWEHRLLCRRPASRPAPYWHSTETAERASAARNPPDHFPDDWRLRAIAGFYWEDNKLFDQPGWDYKNVPSCTSNGDPGTPGNTGCFTNVGTTVGGTVVNPGVQGDQDSPLLSG